MRQHEATSASEYSCALADAFVSFPRCRSSARSSVLSVRLFSAVAVSHTLGLVVGGWRKPVAAVRACLPNAVGLAVSFLECRFVLPRSSSLLTPVRCGSPCRRLLLRRPADAFAVSDSWPLSPPTRRRFHPLVPASLPPWPYLLGRLPAGSPPTLRRSSNPRHAPLCVPHPPPHLSSS